MLGIYSIIGIGKNRGEKLYCPSRSSSPNAGENDDSHEPAVCGTTTSVYEATLAAILTSTNKRIDDMLLSLVANQERRIKGIKAKLSTEITKLRAMISNLQDSVSSTSEEIKEIKEQLTRREPANTSVAAERLEQIRKDVSEHARQIDYLKSQPC